MAWDQDEMGHNINVEDNQSSLQDEVHPDLANDDGDGDKDEEDFEDLENFVFPDDYQDLVRQLGHLWMAATVTHNISIEGASYLWRIAFKLLPKIVEKKFEECNEKKFPQFKHLRRTIMNESLPPVTIRTAFYNLETKKVEKLPPSEKGPNKSFSDVNKYEKLYEISSVNIKDVLKIHSEVCKRHQNYKDKQVELYLSCDGVAESKSSGVSLDVFTVSFPECSTVYPITTIRPIKKCAVNFLAEVTLLLEDFKKNNIKILNVLADNPMRSLLKNMKNHSSYHSCEYCRSSAEYYQDPATKKKLEAARNDFSKKKDAIKIKIDGLLRKQGTNKEKKQDKQMIASLK